LGIGSHSSLLVNFDKRKVHTMKFLNKSSAVAEMAGDRLATTDMGRKVGSGCCAPFRVERAGSPSNTMSPGPKPTSVPSGILVHPTVWPQYTNVTDGKTGQRFHSTGRTIKAKFNYAIQVADWFAAGFRPAFCWPATCTRRSVTWIAYINGIWPLLVTVAQKHGIGLRSNMK